MTLGLLWLAQSVLFVIGILGPWRDPPEARTNGRVARPIRMTLSLSLLAAAALVYRSSTGDAVPYAAWVLLGMTASSIGDFIMARLIPVPRRLIGGMTAFGVGHAFYIAAYVRTLLREGAVFPNPGLWLGLALFGAVTVAGWLLFIRNPAKPAALNTAALLYGAWIAFMASCAMALATGLGGWWWLTVMGAISFVASDFLIGITEIGGRPLHNANDWIWLTYVAGQMGIIYAGALA
jgi:hypothetical protein